MRTVKFARAILFLLIHHQLVEQRIQDGKSSKMLSMDISYHAARPPMVPVSPMTGLLMFVKARARLMTT